MGYLWLLILLIVVAGGLWLAGKLRGPAIQVMLATMFVGAAGYALQGNPTLAGAPKEDEAPTPALALTGPRQAMLGTFTGGERFLLVADAFARRGNTSEEIGAVKAGLKRYPDDLALRIGLANALVDHAQMMTPAAELAFEKARALNPRHPAPYFFEGLARARGGDPEAGLALLRRSLALTPEGVSYRPMIAQGVAMLSGAIAEQQMVPPRQGGAPAPTSPPAAPARP